MKAKTLITLPNTLLKEIDERLDNSHNRSTLIEDALRDYIERSKKRIENKNDLQLINNSADELNQEAAEVLSYQVGI